MRVSLWGSALAGSISLLFAPTQGFVASVFFVVFAVSLLVRYRAAPAAALSLAVGLAASGLVLGTIPFGPVRDFADGIVACAILVVLTILYRDATAERRAPAPGRAGLRLLAAALTTHAELSARVLLRRFGDRAWHRLWVGVAIAAVLACALLGAGAARGSDGWRLVGGPDGAAVWNAAFLEASLQRDGSHLRDGAIATADGSGPRVGIADSPLLTAAKLALPARWYGPEIANSIAILNLAALLICAVLFVAALTGTVGGAAIAVVVAFVVSPLLRQVGATATFDLWPALAVTTLALRRPSPALFAGAAAARAAQRRGRLRVGSARAGAGSGGPPAGAPSMGARRSRRGGIGGRCVPLGRARTRRDDAAGVVVEQRAGAPGPR